MQSPAISSTGALASRSSDRTFPMLVTPFSVLLLLLVVLPCFAVSAQDVEAGKLRVYAGATFHNNPAFDTVVLVEFPFVLNRSEFEFFRPDTTDSRYFARIFAQLNLFGIDGAPLDSMTTYFSAAVSDLAQAADPDYRLFNSLALLLEPGVYSAKLTVIDVKSKSEGTFALKRIVVEPPRKGELNIGGKCLAYSVEYVGDRPEAAHDRLVKNGYRVLTNPLHVFDHEDSVMCLYAELYNLSYTPGDTSRYKLGYLALNDSGAVVRDFGYRLKPKPGSTLVVTDCIDITGFPPGSYRLRMQAADFATRQSDTAFIDFHILSTETLAADAPKPQVNAWDPYDTLSLQTRLNLVHYLLDPVQRKTIESLTETGKQRFLDQYWQESDPDPTTSVNELRAEIIQRYIYCNAVFSTSIDSANGWRTDRGRIYMTYGRYDQRDDVEAPRTGDPFEVWYYREVREGAVFVFVDRQGFHDYTLVHSNVDGEIFSESWEERLDEELYRVN